MKFKIIAIALASLIFVTEPCSAALTENQKQTADVIAKVTAKNYDKYGVLPSVAVTQAFVESSLGVNCSGYNLWGIRSGAEQYSSLKNGVLRYLEVINNGYYEGAPFEKDYHKQLALILDGGYCEPVGNYYEDGIWGIENYNFDNYDKMIHKKKKTVKNVSKQVKRKYIRIKPVKYEELQNKFDAMSKSVYEVPTYSSNRTFNGLNIESNRTFNGLNMKRRIDIYEY